jgi:hypothetical protein
MTDNPKPREDDMCPTHGDTLRYAEDQGGEYETREHLECSEFGCDYEVWA